MWSSLIRPSLAFVLTSTLLLGLGYPLAITAVAQLLLPSEANGSLVEAGGRVVGSALVGQSFSGDRFFHPRPSATSAMPYDGSASTGSNLGPSNPALLDSVKSRVDARRGKEESEGLAIPVDLVTASGSGLDPHISPASARLQVPRVARARMLPEATVLALVDSMTEPRLLGLFGAPRVNVLRLNLRLESP